MAKPSRKFSLDTVAEKAPSAPDSGPQAAVEAPAVAEPLYAALAALAASAGPAAEAGLTALHLHVYELRNALLAHLHHAEDELKARLQAVLDLL